MTDVTSEAPEQSVKPQTKVKLEIFDQGMLTLFWDEIMEAAKAMAHHDVKTMALFAGQLRRQKLFVVGAWVGETLRGLAFIRQVTEGLYGMMAMSIDGLYGNGMTSEQWCEAIEMLAKIAKDCGFQKIIGQSDNPAVAAVAEAGGFRRIDLYIKDLTNV